ncbi:hypothetical protein EVB91_248 [Rhizobium phage RHph_I1_18]|nr:hypothetical protein EVB91_248 [Rhizobium phage RHph_I1_18]
MNVINLAEFRKQKQEQQNQPAKHLVFHDEIRQINMYTFTASYRFDTEIGNRSYSIEFFADNFDDAYKRVDAIRKTISLDGQLMEKDV